MAKEGSRFYVPPKPILPFKKKALAWLRLASALSLTLALCYGAGSFITLLFMADYFNGDSMRVFSILESNSFSKKIIISIMSTFLILWFGAFAVGKAIYENMVKNKYPFEKIDLV